MNVLPQIDVVGGPLKIEGLSCKSVFLNLSDVFWCFVFQVDDVIYFQLSAPLLGGFLHWSEQL